MSETQSHERHGALMDSIYRWTRHVYDASRKYFLFGRDTAIKSIPVQSGDVIVEVGCGTARNLRLLSKHHPSAKLAGLDASSAMLETARKALDKDGLVQVPLVHGYAEQLDPAQQLPDGYGTVRHFLYSYCLTMIPPWRTALERGWDLLPAGGTLNIVDFGTMTGLPGVLRRPMLGFLRAFHVTPQAEIHNWALGLDGAKVTQKVIAGGYAVHTRVEKLG